MPENEFWQCPSCGREYDEPGCPCLGYQARSLAHGLEEWLDRFEPLLARLEELVAAAQEQLAFERIVRQNIIVVYEEENDLPGS